MSEPKRVAGLAIFLAICLCAAATPAAAQGPANDLCEDAIEIDCSAGPVRVAGSTSEATFDGAPFCGTSNTAPGVWYKVTHPDGGIIRASTCNDANYDTKISVYGDGCGALGCVTGLDDTPGCGGFTTELEWAADPGEEYLVLVHGFSSATGDFGLTVSCLEPAENDLCEDAVGPLPVGSVTAGSTSNATLDEPPSIDCGTSVTAPGVWYTVEGTGNTMTASTCNDGDPATGSANYDTKISVYCADCETKECIGGQDDNFPAGCAGFSTKFSWPTQAGQTYNVLVHGFSTQTGDFNLAILDDGVPASGANDCDGVPEDVDLCLGSSVPEPVPTSGTLAGNHSALTGDSGAFETAPPNPQGLSFTTADTAGCSCEQIVDLLHLGEGHLINGCSPGAMQNFLTLLEEASCGNCVEAHGGIGCEVAECQDAVCGIDPFCCNVFWDGICAAEARDLCVPDLCIALPSGLGPSGLQGERGAPFSDPEAKVPFPSKE